MPSFLPCAVCGIAVRQPATGRPKQYCSPRHKQRAKRKRERDRDRAQLARTTPTTPERGEPAVAAFGAPLCHVCGQYAATAGAPVPLLCGSCAKP
jgi:hypothetical protein